MEKTPHCSYKIGTLPEGCRLCVQGRKTVLFITGICSKHCYYCPISDLKYGKDVIYANEWNISNFNQLVEEIKLCESKGVGITGGDPLCRLSRTVKYIKNLKKIFSENFHIHLYTPLNLVTEDALKKLHDSGLDEIRFHPDEESEWGKMELALKFSWKVGVEIPAVPGNKEQIIKLIDYLDRIRIHFLNINELEISDTNAQNLVGKGFKPKDEISYGVKGSETLALELLDYCEKKNINVHYCTTTLKDKIQMARRIKLRSKNVKKSFDKVSEEGMLIRGAIYLPEYAPSFGYKNKINSMSNKEIIINKLNVIRDDIIKKNHINPDMIAVDEERLRLLTSTGIIKHLKTNDMKRAIVTEYPTRDCFIVEIDFVN
ncbi:radical SAM protein [Candidatus Woesearchaeota archaeon]|nr:radical SAM protein [Candidatus Woesearchaeota archaeon]